MTHTRYTPGCPECEIEMSLDMIREYDAAIASTTDLATRVLLLDKKRAEVRSIDYYKDVIRERERPVREERYLGSKSSPWHP